MGSGAKSSEPDYHEEYYAPANIALANGDYTSATVYAYMSGNSNYMALMNNLISQKQTEESNKKLAEQQAQSEARQAEQQAQTAAVQTNSEQSVNANSKATVVADSYTREVKGNANAGNQTSGQVSGAQTARKTLQGFGGDDSLDNKETWY